MIMEWKGNAYEGFSLTEDKKADCKRIAMILVHEALRHYRKFDSSEPREMDRKRWKPIKSTNNVTMYRERHPSRRVVKDSHNDSAGWQMPRVIIGNGTVSKNFDDLLYGLAYGDEAAGLQGVSYAGTHIPNAQILSRIEKPSLEHPYRSTCLQWHTGSPSPALRGIVKDRDAVYIRSTGVLQVGKGERIGYNLTHSLDLPSTPPLEGQGIIRCRLSSCTLFKPLADESVEVFIKGFYEVFGNDVLDSIAVVTVADALMDNWVSGQCAKMKKLSWVLQRKDADRNDVMDAVDAGGVVSRSECRTCKRRFGPLRKAYPCTLCESSTCRKCILPIELLDVVPDLMLMTSNVRLCPACDAFISQASSYKVAQQEILAGRYENESTGSTVMEPYRIYMLEDSTSDLSGKESCAGEIYEFDSDQFSPSTEGSLVAFAELTSSLDDPQVFESRRKMSVETSLAQGTADDEDELEALIENVWRSSISELDVRDQERDRQLAWLKMTELRLRQEDSATMGL